MVTEKLILSPSPESVELRRLYKNLDRRRDEILSLDLSIEALRHTLEDFEIQYETRLAEEHQALDRSNGLLSHLEGWRRLLHNAKPKTVDKRGPLLQKQRDHRIYHRAKKRAEHQRRHQQKSPDTAKADDRAPDAKKKPQQEQRHTQRLKEIYRALARKYHPDLAHTEAERIEAGEVMRRINTLYKHGDLERLEALHEGRLEAEDYNKEQLSARLEWLDAIFENMREERMDLEASPTCVLWRDVEQAKSAGKDLFENIREELWQRIERNHGDLKKCAQDLESTVKEFNAKNYAGELERSAQGRLTPFDPKTEKNLVRLALDALQTIEVRGAAKDLGDWMVELAGEQDHILNILFFTYISELSPFPLAGLDSFDALEERYHALCGDEVTLAEALGYADEVVEYGVKRAGGTVCHTALRFRNRNGHEAMLYALSSFSVRRLFRAALQVLGSKERCQQCSHEGYTLPLFRLVGIDSLHATVCQSCGAWQQSYWMPKGDDVQKVLNAAYIDLELIEEWNLHLGRGLVGTQLLPMQVEEMNCGNLKKQIYRDVFQRYDMPVKLSELSLFQNGKRIKENTPLLEIDASGIALELKHDELSEQSAYDMLRHRIRRRFSD